MPYERKDGDPACIVLEYNAETKGFRWQVHGTMPSMELIGTLELLKSVLVDNEKMKMAGEMVQARSGLIVPAKMKI
jgi:hypothetical protein